MVVVANDVEVDDKAGAVVTSGAKEFADPCGHGTISPKVSGRRTAVRMNSSDSEATVATTRRDGDANVG